MRFLAVERQLGASLRASPGDLSLTANRL
jgi:hypothetical protein